jgi:hypothetical protein
MCNSSSTTGFPCCLFTNNAALTINHMADTTNKETRSGYRAGMIAAVDFKLFEGRHLVAGVVADWVDENRAKNVEGASKKGQ